MVADLSAEYELRPINRDFYETILTLPWAWDLCGNIREHGCSSFLNLPECAYGTRR
ncbi:MAG: GNAT family N-acetyltransferase [Firmicutes bacterium]|nr:GNAT family N-acetyltransferase [Bacillota bacterium]